MAFWPLSMGGGQVGYDLAGNSPMTFNGPVWGVANDARFPVAPVFDDAASQYLEYAGSVVVAEPMAFVCWFRSDDTTNAQALIGIGTSSGSARWQIDIAGNVAGDPVRAGATNSGGTSGNASTTTGYSTNTWHHAAALFMSVTNRAVYIDSGSKGTNSTSISVSGTNRTTVGTRYSSGARGAFMSGRIAEVGIWDLTGWGATVGTQTAAFERAIQVLYEDPFQIYEPPVSVRHFVMATDTDPFPAGRRPPYSTLVRM